MSWYDWLWIVQIVVVFVTEMIGVFFDGRRGIDPLTTLVRDRAMRRRPLAWVGMLVFWLWLGHHFFLEGAPW